MGGANGCFAGMLAKPPKLTTGYWDFRGIGAPMRMMCVFAKADFEDVKYHAKQKANGKWVAPEWEREHKPGLKELNPLVQLPYVVNHTTNEVVSQSTAVCLYLGRLFGLNGASREEQVANEQVLFHVYGMQLIFRDLVYPFQGKSTAEGFEDNLAEHFSTVLPGNYAKLEDWLRQRQTTFIVGRQPCTADFHVWELLDQEEAMARSYDYPSPLRDFECLQAVYHRFKALPRLRPYFENSDSKLPINNQMAFFR
eukprot:TRINITY_DN24124_c0_g1_i1.p1 TRINITY_DN24124_c0_g1~~TRINITY_DN24124_c0_g1_i1.p1  ORF type:complete len:253 (-),score=45.31 TRINITY_DN24124_c0_g1_i1:71-829(-)